jgi:hypothetical protein
MNGKTPKNHGGQRTALRLSAGLFGRRMLTPWRAGALMVAPGLLLLGLPALTGQAVQASYQAQASVAVTMSNCPNGVTSDTDATADFVVWACDDGPGAAVDEAAALALADSIYTPMTTLMGAPLPDDNGGIDIYLLSSGQSLTRQGKTTTLSVTITSCSQLSGTGGVARPDPATVQGTGASGYVVLSRPLLEQCASDFTSTLVHEYFHVLEFHYNTTLSCPKFWFAEASATWAEWQFAPATAPTIVYPYFSQLEAKPSVSLTNSAGRSPYADWMWPLFMQQQAGGPAVIAAAWKAMAGVTGCAALNNAINLQVPFDPNFGNFALENFDSPLKNIGDSQESQWPTGFSSMYQQLASNLPEQLPKESKATPATNTTTSEPVSVPDLATQYNQWTTGVADNNYGLSFEFDFSGITNRQNLDIIAIAAERNETTPHDSKPFLVINVPASSDYLRICAPADGNINGNPSYITKGIVLNLILANDSIASGGDVGGSYTVTPRSTCAASASGNYTETYSTPGPESYNETVTLTGMQFYPAPADTGAPGWEIDLTQGTYTYTSNYGSGSGPLSEIVQSPPPKVLPTLFAWDIGSYNTPNFGINATEFQSYELTVEGGICPLSGAWTTGEYINNFQAVDFTCMDSSNGTTISTSGTIQAQDPILCGIWGGSSCPVTASPASTTPTSGPQLGTRNAGRA